MMLRKSLWDHIGGFKEGWHHTDWDWLVNARKLCRTQVNDQYLVAIRTHKNQLSAHNQYNGSTMSEAVEVIKSASNITYNNIGFHGLVAYYSIICRPDFQALEKK